MKKMARRNVTDGIQEERKRPWSNLHLDLMENIMKRLCYVDHMRMRAVCNSWRSMYWVSPLKQLPWLMAFDEEEPSWSSCKLFDPVYKKTYTLNIEDGKTGLIQGRNFDDIHIHACKHGWFLMSPSNNPTGQLFAYSPFSNGSVIELPPLPTPFQIATFSSTPVESDCVFFALHSQSNTTITRVSTYCREDTQWTTHTYKYELPILHAFCKATFLEGSFYCSSHIGNLATYNIAKREWRVLQRPRPATNHQIEFQFDIYLVESNGDILFIEMLKGEDERIDACPRHSVYKLDRLKRRWDVYRLDGQMLFLGGCDVSLPTTVAGRKLEGKMANRIHRCWEDKLRHFKTNESRSYSCLRYYGSLADKICRKMWVDIPYSTGAMQ